MLYGIIKYIRGARNIYSPDKGFGGVVMFRKPVLFLFCFVLVFCAVFSSCAESFRFYVSPDGDFSVSAITLTKVSGRYYLFLPGQVRLKDLRIGFSGTQEEVFLNGVPLQKGSSAVILRSENILSIGSHEISFEMMQGSEGLPVLYITTESGSIDKINENKKYKEPGNLIMTGPDGNTIYEGALTYIKMRGNASTKFPKKNYQIKLEKGKDLLGMGKAKKWILSGNWLDKSFLRNELSFDLADYMNIPYTPQHHQAELYINHEYAGLFLFSEKVEINNNRIEIRNLEEETENLNRKSLSSFTKIVRKLKNGVKIKAYDIPNIPEDISGGYLIEYESIDDRYNAEPSGFLTKREISIVIKSPEYASVSQAAYIASIMQGFENAIFSSDGIDPDTGKHFYEFVDMQSLVRKYLLNEFIKNYDGNSSSEFFYKPEDSVSGLVYAGPVWDLDNSYADYAREYNQKLLATPEGLFISGASTAKNWWPNLYRQPEFYDAVIEYFNMDFRIAVEIILGYRTDPSGRLKSLDEYQNAIRKSAEMNYVLFPYLKKERGVLQTGETFQENIDYLRSFINDRMEYLNREWIENDENHMDLQFLVR